MADSSLDDFFAKKDKRNKKKKSMFTPIDLLEQAKEEPKKPEEKPREEEKPADDSKPAEKTWMQKRKEQDEQWVDFEEEKDYSGLRIQNIKIGEGEQEEVSEKQEGDGEEGEDDADGPAGPWNVGTQPTRSNDYQEEAAPRASPQPAETESGAPTGRSKYVPPSLRGQMAASALPGATRAYKGKKKVAPNLTSEEDFPTLGGGAPVPGENWGGSGFEKVKSGGSRIDSSNQSGARLELGNKYGALGAE